jgi:hypothetical protein
MARYFCPSCLSCPNSRAKTCGESRETPRGRPKGLHELPRPSFSFSFLKIRTARTAGTEKDGAFPKAVWVLDHLSQLSQLSHLSQFCFAASHEPSLLGFVLVVRVVPTDQGEPGPVAGGSPRPLCVQPISRLRVAGAQPRAILLCSEVFRPCCVPFSEPLEHVSRTTHAYCKRWSSSAGNRFGTGSARVGGGRMTGLATRSATGQGLSGPCSGTGARGWVSPTRPVSGSMPGLLVQCMRALSSPDFLPSFPVGTNPHPLGEPVPSVRCQGKPVVVSRTGCSCG